MAARGAKFLSKRSLCGEGAEVPDLAERDAVGVVEVVRAVLCCPHDVNYVVAVELPVGVLKPHVAHRVLGTLLQVVVQQDQVSPPEKREPARLREQIEALMFT